MEMDRKLRIAIDCRIPDSKQGIGTAVLSLARALSESQVEHQDYTFIVLEEMRGWLEPYLRGPCRLALIPKSSFSRAKSILRSIAPLRFLWKALRSGVSHIPQSDGFVESQQFDLVHFPTQTAYLTSTPSIYQPWDLQHVHLPQFFSSDDRAVRDRTYRAYCHQASFVCVQAQWTRRDIVQSFSLPEEKVVVIPWGSVFDSYPSPSPEAIFATRQKYSLPPTYFVYPAVTWPHKNHEVIFRALSELKKKRGLTLSVYFTGASTPYRATLDRLALQLDVAGQVHFLGFLEADELQAVFNSATAMIFPSRFEGFGLPILEAFHAGLPVLASSASTLPEVAQDGALFFDPESPSELAELVERLLNDEALRLNLIARGAAVLAAFSMQDTVAAFQDLYDRTAAMKASAR